MSDSYKKKTKYMEQRKKPINFIQAEMFYI